MQIYASRLLGLVDRYSAARSTIQPVTDPRADRSGRHIHWAVFPLDGVACKGDLIEGGRYGGGTPVRA